MSTQINVRPGRVLSILLWAIALITMLTILGELSRNFDSDDRDVLPRVLRLLRRNFNPSAEQTVGTWFSVVLLIWAGALAAIVAAVARAARARFARHWAGLAAIFVFLSCDEAASLHEQLGEWVRSVIPTGGILLWAWVIPYSLLALVVGLTYLRFLVALPRETRRRVLLAATLYIGGALVLEMVQAGITDWRGRGGGPVSVLAVVEETAEMLGVAIMIVALLHHIATHSSITLRVGSALGSDPPAGTEDGPKRRSIVDTPTR